MIRKGIQKPNLDTDEEFGIVGATYYAVTESSSYPFTARQDLKYGSRKYNTLAAAKAAIPTTPTSPTVINIIGSWSSADTASVSFYSINTTSSNSILVRAIGEARHSGVWSASAYRFEPTGLYTLDIDIDFCTFDGIQLTNLNESATSRIMLCRKAVIARNIIGRDTATIKGLGLQAFGGSNHVFINCIIFDSGDGISLSATATVSNCTVINCTNGFISGGAGSNKILKNCIAQNCTDGFSGSFDALSDYNISDLSADAPGSNSINSYTVVFKDAANDDYHLDISDSRLRGIGADLRSTFTKDIDGEIRDQTGAYDIGADEYHSFTSTIYDHYIYLNGSTHRISTPSSATNTVTGSLDLRVKVAADFWEGGGGGWDSFISSWDTVGNQGAFEFCLRNTGKIYIAITQTGGAYQASDSALVTGFTNGEVGWVRVTFNAATSGVQYFKSSDYDPTDESGTWTWLGTSTFTGITGIYPSTHGIDIGAVWWSSAWADTLPGKFYYAEVRDGIDGTVVARFNASEIDGSETYISNIDGQEKWTNNGGTYTSA